MKLLSRILWIFIFVIVLLLAVRNHAAYWYLQYWVHESAGLRLRAGTVNVDQFLPPRIRLYEARLLNPPGYASNEAVISRKCIISLKDGFWTQLLNNPHEVAISEIELDISGIRIERNVQGQTNLAALKGLRSAPLDPIGQPFVNNLVLSIETLQFADYANRELGADPEILDAAVALAGGVAKDIQSSSELQRTIINAALQKAWLEPIEIQLIELGFSRPPTPANP